MAGRIEARRADPVPSPDDDKRGNEEDGGHPIPGVEEDSRGDRNAGSSPSLEEGKRIPDDARGGVWAKEPLDDPERMAW